MRQRSEELWAKWRGLLSEQRESGQPVAAFCSDRDLRRSIFYKWKQRIGENDGPQFVEVKVRGWRKAEPTEPPTSQAIEVRLKRERSLVVEPGFDANHLRALLRVLEAEA